MIAVLDDNRFARREQAMKEIRELGPRAEAAFGKAGKGKLSTEQRDRIEKLLAAIGDPKLSLTHSNWPNSRRTYPSTAGHSGIKKTARRVGKGG